MSDYIKEIPSDSTVEKIHLSDDSAIITVKLDIYKDNKDTVILTFQNVWTIRTQPGWNAGLEIEAVEVKTSGELLDKTRNILLSDGESAETVQKLKLYQFVGSDQDKYVIELVASSYTAEVGHYE